MGWERNSQHNGFSNHYRHWLNKQENKQWPGEYCPLKSNKSAHHLCVQQHQSNDQFSREKPMGKTHGQDCNNKRAQTTGKGAKQKYQDAVHGQPEAGYANASFQRQGD
jgi:hypothetical protein